MDFGSNGWIRCGVVRDGTEYSLIGDTNMELKDCKHGIIVSSNCGAIGMIIGITNNIPHADKENRRLTTHAIPLVQWSHGETSGVHHNNISPFEKEES